MQSVIRFTVSPHTAPCVTTGDIVAKNQFIARGAHTHLENLNFSQLLNCKPKDVLSFLEFSLGSVVEKDSILARRKSFLSEYIVKAQDRLEIVSIGDDGIVTTRRFTGHDIVTKSPVKGTVKDVSDQYIDIAFDGLYLPATKSKGTVYAPILAMNSDAMYTMNEEVSGKVVVVKAQAGIMSKLLALGASGVVTTSNEIDNDIAYAILDQQTIDILTPYNGQYVLLDGEHRCLIL